MSAEQENFDRVVDLLKSKQQPQKPPGFYDKMSAQIINGIKHPPPEEKPTWWQRFQSDINLRACAVGFVVCGVVLYAVFSAMRHEPPNVVPYATTPSQVILPPYAPIPATPPVAAPPSQPKTVPPMNSPVRLAGHGEPGDSQNIWSTNK